MNRFIALVVGLLWLPVAANAASFDCRKAATVVEKMICSDKTLSGLDDELASIYRMARAEIDADKAKLLAQAQKHWLRSRNACESRGCLRFEYDQRIAQLREIQLMGSNPYLLESPPDEGGDEDEDLPDALILRCNFADDKTDPFEFVEIRPGVRGQGDAPAIQVFDRNGKSDSRSYYVEAGDVAECVFPSGNRVRLKVGATLINPYGACGADPMIFASLWVNGRKVVSRLWFAGHCITYGGQSPLLSFQIWGGPKTTVTKCEAPPPGRSPAPTGGAKHVQPQAKTSCTQLPDIAGMPVDVTEYPPAGSRRLSPGTIDPLMAGHAVCREVQNALVGSFYFLSSEAGSRALPRPKWTMTGADLPEELKGSGESQLDFDNDGNIDRLLSREYQGTYMQGSVLLVQPGRSSKELKVGSDPLDKSSMFLPCQMDSRQPQITQCPPFSQEHDEAGYEIGGARGGESVFFRGRYTDLTPFTFERTTYLGLRGLSENSSDYVAIVKPLPGRKFQPMCLFRRVPENF